METIRATPITKGATIEVFKTNVNDSLQANDIIKSLVKALPYCKINFDLQDCDKILRIEGIYINIDIVMDIVNSRGYICEVLV